MHNLIASVTGAFQPLGKPERGGVCCPIRILTCSMHRETTTYTSYNIIGHKTQTDNKLLLDQVFGWFGLDVLLAGDPNTKVNK